jgi:endonuclease G
MVMGNPSGATADVSFPDNYLMLKLQYALSFNNTREIPNWTSWHLDSTWRGSAPRQDDFRADTTLPPGFNQVSGSAYSGSGFDRGHMCPSADRTSSIPDNSATFLMTNMIPQAPGNNQGPWASMENYLRTFLPSRELYIVSGGTGVGGTGSGGGTTNVLPSGVTVPQKTWKVVLILTVGDNDLSRVDINTRTIAVIMPNLDSIRPDQWQKYLATVDQVEALSGYDFFSNVDPAIQSAIESKPDDTNDTAPVTTGQNKSVPMDGSVPVTLSATDFNVNNQFTFTIVTPPQHGSLSGSGANRTYSPSLHYFGPDSFTFKANDGAFDSNTSTVSITVNGGPTAAPATIGGRVTNQNGGAVAGVVMHLSGESSAIAITDREGNYSFRDVDTNSVYSVTPSLANYHFNPASLSFSLLGNKTDATFTAVADAITANAIDSTEYFVRQQYLDFLGREPDQGGFRYWTNQINSCNGDTECIRTRRIDVAAAFFIEREFQDTGFFIYRAYRAAFGERPRYGQFNLDRNQIVGGANIEAQRTAFLNSFVQRVEFQERYPADLSNDQFVDQLASQAGIDNTARQQLRDLMSTGASRAEVFSKLIELREFAAREYNGAFVLTQYFGYLRRDVDRAGYEFWLNVLNSREAGASNYRAMVCAFITSAEYQRRFSPIVTRNNGDCGQ